MQHPFHRRGARPILAVAALFLAACGSDSKAPPQSLGFFVELESPNGAEGAAVLELDGDVAAVRAPAGSRVLTYAASGMTRVIVVLDQPGTIAFEIDLAERGPAPEARVIEVSDPNDALRAPSSRYDVSFRARP